MLELLQKRVCVEGLVTCDALRAVAVRCQDKIRDACIRLSKQTHVSEITEDTSILQNKSTLYVRRKYLHPGERLYH